jgi:hypothetical protein
MARIAMMARNIVRKTRKKEMVRIAIKGKNMPRNILRRFQMTGLAGTAKRYTALEKGIEL